MFNAIRAAQKTMDNVKSDGIQKNSNKGNDPKISIKKNILLINTAVLTRKVETSSSNIKGKFLGNDQGSICKTRGKSDRF